MILPDPASLPSPAPLLRFACGGCGHDLEAPVAYAGVEGPCPMCGTAVRAPWEVEERDQSSEDRGQGTGDRDQQPAGRGQGSAASGQWAENMIPIFPISPIPQQSPGTGPQINPRSHRPGGLHLPPLNEDTGLVEFPGDFWQDVEEKEPLEIEETGLPEAFAGPAADAPPAPVLEPITDLPSEIPVLSKPVALPEPRTRVLLTREDEEAAEVAGMRKQEFRLRFFDAALILLFAGTLAMGGAALAFTQSKKPTTPVAPPELSRQVMERMEQMDQRRDQAVQEARETVRHWVTASESAAVEKWCLPGDPVPAIPGTAGAGAAPVDFEFIQARRITGTDRFLTMFEVLSDPPLVVPVEETPAGPRLHGRAIVQQQTGTLAKFLASQGQGEAVFYVLLRPGPPPMAEELVKARPDLGKFLHIAVEPAFPADGAAACLACVQPDSEAAALFAKRTHDPGLRPAVVKLAWRQHRESGNYVELVSFEPNAWSRH